MKKIYNTYFNRLLLLLVFSLGGLHALGQTIQITGKVSDASGIGIPNVSVLIKNTRTGTATTGTGNYSITAKSSDVLIFSYTGYLKQEIAVGGRTSINVQLAEDNQNLEEIVVVGYGTASRTKITSSIVKLDSRVLESGMRSNPAQALAGTVAGIRVATTTGRPGSVPSITLRGGTNFDGSGSPLIVVDGQVRASFSDINPEDIESMEVLKDASATAIYGARASNGVILVTSKRGKAGSSNISLKAKNGINYLNSPYDVLSAEDYIYWNRLGVVEAMRNGTLGTFTTNSALSAVGPRGTGNLYKDGAGNILDGNYDNRAIWSTMRLTDINKELLSSNAGWRTMKDPIPTNAAGNYDPNGSYADLIFKEFNYGDYAFKSPAVSQDYNIGMSGGNEKGAYYANLGYYDEDGLSLETFYKRYNFTFNGDYKVKEWIKSESSLQFSRANWRDQSILNGEGNFWGRMLFAPPTMRGTNTKGEWILGRDASDGNPAFNIDKFKRSNQNDKITLNQAFKIDILKNLFVKVSGIVMYDESHAESFNRDFRTGLLSTTNVNTGWNRDRSSTANFDRSIRQTYTAVANYKTRFLEKNNLEVTAGYEYFDAYNKGFSAGGRLAPTDDFQDLGLTVREVSGVGARDVDSYHTRERILSSFARVNYDWNDKYLASFTVRRDGYSRLIGDNQFGTFPAVSAGWLVHKEGFMKSTENWLSMMKLRASYGLNGDIGQVGRRADGSINLYELQGSYGAQTPYNGVVGFLQSGLANPGLRWEKSNTVEGGLEMGFFQNRITTSVAVYNRVTKDKITNILLPASSGVSNPNDNNRSSIRTNNGTMRNTGVELEATVKAVQKDDLLIQFGVNASWNKNKVLKLPFNGNDRNRQDGQQIYDPLTGRLIWVGGLQEGQEPNEQYGFVSEGIIRTAEDLAAYNKIDLAAGQVWYGASAGKKVASQALINARNLNPNAAAPTFIATQLGDMKWKDVDQNDTIDTRDMVFLGRSVPRWTGGFNLQASWKGLSLYSRIDFAFGHIQQDFQQMWTLGSMQGEFNGTQIIKETWTPNNIDAKYPRYTWADQLNSKNFDRPSSMFFVNSGYLSFREVTLSYSVPKKLLQKAKIAALTLNATGQNLGYVTNKQLNLPERGGHQVNPAYTIPTSLIFGANLTF